MNILEEIYQDLVTDVTIIQIPRIFQ